MEITTSVMQDIRVRNLFPATGAFFMELGCGAGNSLDEVSGHFRRTVGVDISRRRLSERKVPPADWEFVLSDLNAMLPFDSNSADAVLANQVIEHIVDPNFFAREIYRVLKGKGVVVVTTPNFRYVKHLYRIVVLGRGPKTANDDTRDGPWDDGHLHYFSHRDLSEIFSRAGFSKVRSRALIDLNGRHGTVRQLLDAFADSFLVREFLSGNALLVAQK
jgi:ubiquinone/menaquinone biosynthesis C-methylase UbiE